jgi:hypothetical protein
METDTGRQCHEKCKQMTWRYQGCNALEKDNGLGIGLGDTVTGS